MKFVKGKWYSGLGSEGNYICKIRVTTNRVTGIEVADYIWKNKFCKNNSGTIDACKSNVKEVSISEIRHLLPKDYKFEQEFNYYFY